MYKIKNATAIIIFFTILVIPVSLTAAQPGLKIEHEQDWMYDIAKLYLKDKLSLREQEHLLKTLENNLGIEPDGTLDFVQAWNAKSDLHTAVKESSRESDNVDDDFLYLVDRMNLLGLNYIYFHVCAIYEKQHAERFIRYFENGFYPNRAFFIKEGFYYKILNYYLYLIYTDTQNTLTKTISLLNKNTGSTPPFGEKNIRKFMFAIDVSSELDAFRNEGEGFSDSLYNKVFTSKEREMIDNMLSFLISQETHTAINSYDYFKTTLPLSLSAKVISHNIQQTWIKQSISYRSRLPLMLFVDKDSLEVSVEKIFKTTLEQLALDNREVDILVLSALKIWLSKQIQHGIMVKDRIKYKQLLEEIQVCPSGLIFFNLYDSRSKLIKLREYVHNWDNYSPQKKKSLFDNEINQIYFEATENIDRVFSDLENIFGEEKIYGKEIKKDSINYIFHKYKGEIDYFYYYLRFSFLDKNKMDQIAPLAAFKNNCLNNFKAAFVKADDKKENHINLLKAYLLLFQVLAKQGKINEIQKYENQLNRFISGKHYLSAILDHKDNNLYDIYKVIAYAYLTAGRDYQNHALEIARQSFELSKSYLTTAAAKRGCIDGNKIGAIDKKYTEIDDFGRQYEFYQDISKRLGKKIHLLLPNEDVQLYKRIQKLNTPEGLLL